MLAWGVPVAAAAGVGGLALLLRWCRTVRGESLRESEERYRAIFENSQSVMLLLDPASGRIVQANGAAVRYYGYVRERLTGMPITELNPMPEEALLGEMRRALEKGRSHFSFQHRLASGELREVEVFSGPVRYRGKDFLHSVVHDVQERRTAERELQASEHRYRTLVERLAEGLAIAGEDGRYRFCNRRLEEMLGYGPGELLGLGFGDLAAGGDQGAEPAPNGRRELRLRRKDGSSLDCLVSSAPLGEPGGPVTGLLALVTDITEHKKAEEAARRLQKSEGLNLMAAGIAHDFNNLFQALQGNLERILADPDDSARVRGSAERALRIVGDAAALSRKILDYSGRGLRQAVPVDLKGLLAARLDELQRFLRPGTPFRVDLAEGVPPVQGDPEQILQVVLGLVANAEEALEGGGGIHLGLELAHLGSADLEGLDWIEPPPAADLVTLTVRDEGKGIPASHLGRIFDPFFSTKAAGRGLGLSASIGIIRNHGAGLQVTSSAAGTCFRIGFRPLALEEAPARPAPAEGGDLQDRTLLLVDDDADLREVLAEGLQDLLGYRVLVARDGAEAVEVYREEADRISLILMDAVMPRLTGTKAFDAIRQLRPDAKAILCSGYGDDVGTEALGRHGFHSFLKKPFSLKELAEAIERALGT